MSPGAPKGPANGNWKHGGYSQETMAMARYVRELAKIARDVADK